MANTTGIDGIGNDRGLAMITVLIFAFLLILMGSAFFAMAAYETRQALYREHSSEAFYLADAGVERARGELFANAGWTIDTTGVTLGTGTYDLEVRDTTLAGGDAVLIRSVGHVQNASRAIEVLGKVSPGIPPLLALGDIDVGGNFCLDGHAHANQDADFGDGDQHLNNGNCDGQASYTDGFEIRPPYLFTEPECFPGHTYYYVKVVPSGSPQPFATILAADDSTQLQTALGDSLVDVLSSTGGNTWRFDFDDAAIGKYFDEETGIFKKMPGDTAVVVNFGESPDPLVVELTFRGKNNGNPVEVTIINTRFTGVNLEDRLDWNFWTGGWTRLGAHTTFLPRNGIALAATFLEKSNAQTTIGSPTQPGLVYVTRDIDKINGDFTVYGAILVLRNFVSTGGPVMTWVDHLEDLFPGCYQDITFGTTGILEVFSWREVAANP